MSRPITLRRSASSNRGQSETVGVLVLTGVIIALAVILGLAMTANVTSQFQTGPLVDLDGSATKDRVTLEHGGGETIDVAELDVVLRGSSTERYPLSSFTQLRGGDPSRFTSGDRWRREHDLSGDSVEVLLVHTPTNTIAGRTTLEPRATGPFFEVDITDTNAPVEQGETLETDVSIRNTGIATGTQDIEFEFDGTLEGTETVTLSPGSSTSTTFAYDADIDPGQYTVRASSDNRSAQRTVTVIEPQADINVTAVDGLENGTTTQTYTPTVTVNESADVETKSLLVELIIEERGTNVTAFEVQKTAPDDFPEISAESLDIGFDVGTLEANNYNYFATASADNTVTSGNTGEFVVGEPAFFDVTIDGTNSPVTSGDTVRVDATINNTGGISGTQTIKLEITDADGGVPYTTDTQVTLGPAESQTITLEWDTGDNAHNDSPYTATVSSDDDADSAQITVESGGGGQRTPPTVTTQAATEIGASSATLNGELTDLGTANNVDVYFEYREVGGTWTQTASQRLRATGTFSETVSDLSSGTKYQFRAVAETNNDGSDTGDTRSFTTADASRVLEATEVRDSGNRLVFRMENTGDQQVVVEEFEVDATAIDSDVTINDGNAEELEIRRTSGGDGQANRNGNPDSFAADGSRYDLVDDSQGNGGEYATIEPGDDDVEIDFRTFSPEIGTLELADEGSADVTVTFGLRSNDDQTFYFRLV